MINDRPSVGILLMLGFCVLAPMGDALAKILAATMPIGFLLMVRFGFQAVALIPFIVLGRRPWRMRPRVLALSAIRTILHAIGIGTMFAALRYLPLAHAVAIAFVMPFLMLLLGHFILGEEVGMRRILACVAGFVGTLMVIQPSFVSVGWPAFLPLAVAFLFSLFMLVTRLIAKETDPISIQFVSGVMASGILMPLMLLGTWLHMPVLRFAEPSAADWVLLLAIGALGTCAHLLMTWSLRFAPSATLAPMQYLEIPIATLIGWIIFRDLPNGLATMGICITIASGLYIVIRERATAKTHHRGDPEATA